METPHNKQTNDVRYNQLDNLVLVYNAKGSQAEQNKALQQRHKLRELPGERIHGCQQADYGRVQNLLVLLPFQV